MTRQLRVMYGPLSGRIFAAWMRPAGPDRWVVVGPRHDVSRDVVQAIDDLAAALADEFGQQPHPDWRDIARFLIESDRPLEAREEGA
jgi:hypothetical protein